MNTINEAMRRVKLPAGNNEQFKAGVRALAHAYDEVRKEQATTPTANKLPPAEWRPATPWQDRLYDLVQLAFGNEESFIADLLPNAPAVAIDEFYMAGERCRVVYQPGDKHTTIKTSEFMTWAEGLSHGS